MILGGKQSSSPEFAWFQLQSGLFLRGLFFLGGGKQSSSPKSPWFQLQSSQLGELALEKSRLRLACLNRGGLALSGSSGRHGGVGLRFMSHE